jgi:hypothetical protein
MFIEVVCIFSSTYEVCDIDFLVVHYLETYRDISSSIVVLKGLSEQSQSNWIQSSGNVTVKSRFLN